MEVSTHSAKAVPYSDISAPQNFALETFEVLALLLRTYEAHAFNGGKTRSKLIRVNKILLQPRAKSTHQVHKPVPQQRKHQSYHAHDKNRAPNVA